VDANGSLYVADSGNFRIRVVNPRGLVRTLAGSGVRSTFPPADGIGSAATFGTLNGLAWHEGGRLLYVSDNSNQMVRAVGAGDGNVSTLVPVYPPGDSAHFISLEGAALAPNGDLYLVDRTLNRVRRVNASNRWVTTIAGGGGSGGYADGVGTLARFNTPSGVALGADGWLYVADTGNHVLRRIALASGEVSTLAGSPDCAAGWADGVGSAALFSEPIGLATDAAGELYVADSLNSRVRKVDTRTGVTRTLAGNGSAGFADGVGHESMFSMPVYVAVSGDGTLFVSDAHNHRIRRMVLAPLPPPLPPPPPSPPPPLRMPRALLVAIVLAACVVVAVCMYYVFSRFERRRHSDEAIEALGASLTESDNPDLAAAAAYGGSGKPARMVDIMVSFRGTETGRMGDRSVVFFRDALVARGYTVFITLDMRGGFFWPDLIQSGVRSCSCLVALCSPTYGGTLWTKRELVLADSLGKTILPVWHSGSWPPPGAQIYLQGLQYVPANAQTAGYVESGISPDLVVDELVLALQDAGVYPSGVVAGTPPPPDLQTC
jgi:sugar lactone lactonase YvrE